MAAALRSGNCLFFAAAILFATRLLAAPPGVNEMLGAAKPSATAPAAAPAPSHDDRRTEYAEKLRVAQRKLEEDPADAATAAEIALYKTADTILAQQEAVVQQMEDLKRREADLREQLKTWAATANEAPTAFSFVEFDRLVNQLAAEQARVEVARARVKAARSALDLAQAEFDSREQERRKAQEALETRKPDADATALTVAAEDAKRASKLAAETLELRKKELEREKLAETVQGLSVELLDNKVSHYRPLVVFSEADLQEQLKKLQAQEESVRAAKQRVEESISKLVRGSSEAKRRLDAGEGDPAVLREELEAWRRANDAARDQKNVYLDQLLQLEQLRTAWNRLYRLVSGTNLPQADEIGTWQQDTSAALKALIGSTQGHLLRIDELRNELATIMAKAEAAKDGPKEIRDWIDKQRGYVETLIRVHEANLASIDASRRLHGKLRTELGRGVDLLSPKQWAGEVQSWLGRAWDYEIATHQDLPITVGKIIRALVLFVVGWMLSRMLSTFISQRLLRRFRLSKDAIAVIRATLLYSMVVIAALVALRSAHVPLTAFAILGGALAIGIGFGSQALVNNFISGLIMLAERPVRIGERIVFGNFDGTVEDVGFRCTKLRTLTDHLVTIPNSALINESIENVGRRRTIRRIVNLGITYDTPRDRIVEAVEALRDILEEPGIREPIHPVIGWDKMPPRVFFQDFLADNLSIFLIYWFAPADHWEFMEHAHRVNLRILEEFERLGVSFAFPSRTVYLANDAAQDLRMRLSKEEAA